MSKLNDLTQHLKKSYTSLANEGLKKVFDNIDQLGIKKGVDKLGIDKFINQCAIMAAGSGAIAGSGGVFTMAVGIPFDLVNLITQQFRVTLAVSYYNRGTYKIGFDDFITIVAGSLKIDAGITVTKTILEEIAEKLMINFGAKTAERLVPFVGAFIGGTANYLFIKKMGTSIKNNPSLNSSLLNKQI